MRGAREFLTVLAVLAWAGAAQARRQTAHTMVLPWVTAAKLDHDALAGLDALLVAAARASGRDVLDASEIVRSIKEPRRASLACRGSAACLARLGRRAGVGEVLYTAVEPTPSGLRLLVVLVAVSGAQARGQRLVDIPAGASLEQAVSPVLAELLGAGQPTAKPRSEPPPPEPALAAIDDLDLAPLPSAPPAAPPAPTVIVAAPVTALTPPQELAQSEHTDGPRWLLWGGIGAGALGAMSIAGGAVSGLQSRSAYDKAEPSTTSQLEALRLRRDGDAAASRANLLFLVGSALVAVGAAGVTLDLMSD